MERTVTVVPKDGLHARPASAFVRTAGEFDANVTISPAGNEESARGDSMLAVTSLGIECGDDVVLSATGSDAEGALDALAEVLQTPADELDDE